MPPTPTTMEIELKNDLTFKAEWDTNKITEPNAIHELGTIENIIVRLTAFVNLTSITCNRVTTSGTTVVSVVYMAPGKTWSEQLTFTPLLTDNPLISVTMSAGWRLYTEVQQLREVREWIVRNHVENSLVKFEWRKS